MAGEDEKILYDATKRGDLATVQDVLEKDPYLLDGASFAYSRNLLHIATMWEQVGIVEDLLGRNPQLAEDVDSKNSSPLHIAAAKGYFEITSMLLRVAPETCWSLDGQGMNPSHVAAKNGHVEVLQLNPSPAMERLNCGGTVLHLCVKHGQLRSLQVLVVKYLADLVNAKDDNGDTLLHMAVRCNQLEIVRYLMESTNIIMTARNTLEYTAMEILANMPSTDTNSEIQKIMMEGKTILQSLHETNSRVSKNMMVVLALVAGLAFAAIVNPPGGVWQDDSPTHKAGEAVMATNRPKIFNYFIRCNTGAFVASLIAMYTFNPSKRSSFALIIAMSGFSAALVFVAISYGASLMVILPDHESQTIEHVIYTFACFFFPLYIGIWLAALWKKITKALGIPLPI